MATNCNTLVGFSYDRCEPNLGGVQKVWLANWEEGAVTVDTSTGDTNGVITAITTSSGNTWIEFPMRKNVASMTSNLQVGDEGGVYVQTDLAMVFSKMETSKRLSMVSLATGEIMAIVKDANGLYWFLGKDNPLLASAGAGETGTQKSDPNHYTVTLTDESREYPFQVDESALPASIKPAA